MKRLELLNNSLKKKENEFLQALENHFDDVRSANGQPLNDKRNGSRTIKRWEKQNDILASKDLNIEKTKLAIEREESKISYLAKWKEILPLEIITLIDNGTLKQWGKYPNIFFVEGVSKARIGWDNKNKVIYHKFANTITDKEQRSKFAKIYNDLYKKLKQS